MTFLYHNNSENEHLITEVENQNGNPSVANIPSDEISLLNAIAQEFKTWRRHLHDIAIHMRQATDFNSLLKITVTQIREKINCDRALIYQFTSLESGNVLSESRSLGWTPTLGENIPGIIFGLYTNQDYLESVAIDDTNKIQLTPHQKQLLEKFQIKASLSLPILVEGKVWGLLAVNNCSCPRQWQEGEISLLYQLARELTYRLYSFEFQKELQQQTQAKKSAAKVIDKILRIPNVDKLFQATTQEIRQLLKCDRVGVYRFKPDWSGEFVSESVGNNWVRMVGPDFKMVWEDTHLQETQGGRYAKGETFVVKDIYQTGHAQCHIDILEQFQMMAYIIAPIFSGEKLWGLLAAYQNSGTRDWEQSEVTLLARIGSQFGLALQQTEYLQQLQAQSTKLAEAAGREKAAKELLQQRSIQLLTALRPALNGDLTVRAPITEDELGTIADAYNNTLQALRQIVIQVQAAAQKVAQTSSNSDASLTELTNSAQHQSQELTAALGDIKQMVDSTQAVVANAQLVQLAVQQANQTVESGDTAMNSTVKAIQGIRETVAQTSKKIKRLSESSQKISKVVNLIGNFATQTNVLALNAAIEATRAGEYGKGFAVVADEVRSLSRQSAAATIEIEKLVQEIQTETGEVAVAMETGIQQVVEGTNLVSETRQNLNAIVSATAEISQLIERITAATQQQMTQSVTVTASMQDVAEIANKTFAESQEIATVFEELSGMAQELLTTASKFKVS